MREKAMKGKPVGTNRGTWGGRKPEGDAMWERGRSGEAKERACSGQRRIGRRGSRAAWEAVERAACGR